MNIDISLQTQVEYTTRPILVQNMPRINTEYRNDAKKKIIAAAIEIARNKGWDAMTLDAIAQEVGVTKGALYAYFENSEALQREVILEVFRKIRVGLEKILKGEPDIHQVIRSLAELIFEQQKSYASIFCQIPSRIPERSQYRDEFSIIFNNNIVLLRDYLIRMKTDGKLPQDMDPDQAANAILALTLGFRIISLFLGRDENAVKLVWIDSVERMLYPQSPNPVAGRKSPLM
jgi:AcrR family transcriptional regulator